jgi:hypothetical protein
MFGCRDTVQTMQVADGRYVNKGTGHRQWM